MYTLDLKKHIFSNLFFVIFAFLSSLNLSYAQSQQSEAQKPVLISGGVNTKIAVYEYGNPSGPEILFLHGISQSHLSWAGQYESEDLKNHRLIVIDLRGHGASEKPTQKEKFNESKIWADDIHSVIKAKNLKKPIIVGWSYGGLMIGDYIREYGDSHLGGVVFVDAVTQLGTEDSKTHFGAGGNPLYGMLDIRQEVNIPSTVAFLNVCTFKKLSDDNFQTTLAYNMAVSPETRLSMFSRVVDSNDALSTISVPTLIVHGQDDTVVLPSTSDYIANKISHASQSFYPEAGHCSFIDQPDLFNQDLLTISNKIS